ncbi:MAG: tryptophan-rich sensory protein [Planctomycetes bacterium]|nr:tryptophan-rich sensory protein [Planctomycetota bacterium]
MSRWLTLGVFLVICLGTAGLGAVLTNLSVGEWYANLPKPSWNPPNWVFGPVWTVLYCGMAVAAWLVWSRQGRDRKVAMLLFGLQLCLNAVWSALFFGLRSPGLALADIILLWLAILATILAFRRVSAMAAALLIPYLAWVSFAVALNAAIWRMNP